MQGEISDRLIIVNKHVKQVIESSIDYTSQRFIEIYETLLAESQRLVPDHVTSIPLEIFQQTTPREEGKRDGAS